MSSEETKTSEIIMKMAVRYLSPLTEFINIDAIGKRAGFGSSTLHRIIKRANDPDFKNTNKSGFRLLMWCCFIGMYIPNVTLIVIDDEPSHFIVRGVVCRTASQFVTELSAAKTA